MKNMPVFKYTRGDVLVYEIPTYWGEGATIEVVSDEYGGAWEWLLRAADGKVLKHSNNGYGGATPALRDGLIAVEGLSIGGRCVHVEAVQPVDDSRRAVIVRFDHDLDKAELAAFDSLVRSLC